jgi:membrane fusion protein (multidrug efflux system)
LKIVAFSFNQSSHHASAAASHLIKVVATLTISVALAACERGDQASGQPPAGVAMPVNVIKAQPTSVPVSAEAVAQTEGAKEVEIRPRVGGILLKRLYEEGAAVTAGQPMFLIDPAPYQNALAQAKAQLAEQIARIEQTRREENRLQELLATQSISQREYDNAVSDNAVANAALQQAAVRVRDAELNLSYATVTAPVGGVSGRFQFSEGALVSANTSLLTTIVQLSPIWVRFSFSDNELARFGGHLTEQNVQQVTLILPDGSEYQQKGQLNFAASRIDPLLGTQQLRATFENADQRLLPGQFVRVRVTTGERSGVFVVPQAAVVTSDLGRFVYVVNEKNTATVRPVVAGNWVGTDWVILEGLNAGDKVIVNNIIKLRPGTIVSPQVSGTPPIQAPKVVPAGVPETVPMKAPRAAPVEALAQPQPAARAQIAKDYEAYQKRLKRKFIGAHTQEPRFASYVKDWRLKIEQLENLNYPEAAKRGKLYGTVQLTVGIKSDGSLESVEINRSSGNKILDEAAIRIAKLAGQNGFAPFPPEIGLDTDILHITRTWVFKGSLSE